MDVNLLKKVLSYHVVASEFPPSSVKNELTPNTLTGEKLRVNVYGSGIDEVRNSDIFTKNCII